MACPPPTPDPATLTYQPAISGPLLEGDEVVTGYYRSDSPLTASMSQTGDGVQTLFSFAPNTPIRPSTLTITVSNPADVYTDDGNGNVKLGIATVGAIDYSTGSFDFTAPMGHTPVSTSSIVAQFAPVPKIAVLLDGVKLGETLVNTSASPVSGVVFPDGSTHPGWPWFFVVDPLIRRQRVDVRARVFQYDWSALAEQIVVTQFFREKLINYMPPEMSFIDDQQFGYSATDWIRQYTYSAGDQIYYHGKNYESLVDNNLGNLPTTSPAAWSEVYIGGDLRQFIQIMAVTLDEIKNYIDSFVEVFDIDRCEDQYLPYIATILGYDLNRSDSTASQRRQLKNAVAWYKVKGTFESFKILFYSLGYKINLLELWTEDYVTFVSSLPANYGIHVGLPTYTDNADAVPPDDVRLIENGGTFYRTPHFAIDFANIFTAPNLTAEGLRYILNRISLIRPAHTVLEYLKFLLGMCDDVDFTDEYHNTAEFVFVDDGWFAGYCVIGDPVYVRSGDLFPTFPLFPTRNGTDATAISMKRQQTPTHCDPPEDLEVIPFPYMSETYFIPLRRDGMNIIPTAPTPVDISSIDQTTFPYRGMTDTILRDGLYRYLNTLTFQLFSGHLIGEGILTSIENVTTRATVEGEGILAGLEDPLEIHLLTGEGDLTSTES